MIAFSAMAEATGADDAARRIPALLLRIGLPRPTAEAMATRLTEEYNSTHMVLSDYYRRLPSQVPERPGRLHVPVSEMTAVAQAVIARNPDEIARQATRRMLTGLIQRGIWTALGPDARLNPKALTAVRAAARFFGVEEPAGPGRLIGSRPGDAKSVSGV